MELNPKSLHMFLNRDGGVGHDTRHTTPQCKGRGKTVIERERENECGGQERVKKVKLKAEDLQENRLL